MLVGLRWGCTPGLALLASTTCLPSLPLTPASRMNRSFRGGEGREEISEQPPSWTHLSVVPPHSSESRKLPGLQNSTWVRVVIMGLALVRKAYIEVLQQPRVQGSENSGTRPQACTSGPRTPVLIPWTKFTHQADEQPRF